MAHSYTINQIASALGATVEGDGAIRVTGASEPSIATADQIALAMDPKYGDGLADGDAGRPQSCGRARIGRHWG